MSSACSFMWFQVETGHLRLQLPALRRANIVGYRRTNITHGRLVCDQDSFSETEQLESLRLQEHGTVVLMSNCLVALTVLATLELESCGLANIPAAVIALEGSLTSLALPFNPDLQLAHSDIATLLALRKLRKLDLRKILSGSQLNGALARAVKAKLRYSPSLWSVGSLQHLLNLPNAFSARHGHALAVQVCFSKGQRWDINGYSSEEGSSF